MKMFYGWIEFSVEWSSETELRIATIKGGPYDDDKLTDAVNWIEKTCQCQVVL